MPDQEYPQIEGDWATDKIVSVVQPTEFRYDGTGIRLDRNEPYLRLHFISIYVADQERSLRFFVDKLGFEVVSDVLFASGNRWVEVGPPDGTAILALVRPIPGLNEDRLVGNSGMVTFLTDDVLAKFNLWSERGVNFVIPPQTPSWGGTFCRFVDPDGNTFALAGFDHTTRELDRRRREHAERLESQRRVAQELEIAKQVQARLFPQCLPQLPGLDYAGVCLQARSVGGDYFDFLDLGDGRLALVVGDIAGKGIAASLLMANLQANMRSQSVSASENPRQYLSSVNRLLFANTTPNAYATLFFSDFDHRTGRLLYANCGHLPALILRAGGAVELLEATCTVVGLFQEWECSTAECQLNPGDTLALYTDGVTESPDGSGEEFGEQRLIQALLRHRDLPAATMAKSVVEEVVGFSAQEQFDDITLIVAKRL